MVVMARLASSTRKNTALSMLAGTLSRVITFCWGMFKTSVRTSRKRTDSSTGIT